MKLTSIFKDGEISTEGFTQAVIDLMCQIEVNTQCSLEKGEDAE